MPDNSDPSSSGARLSSFARRPFTLAFLILAFLALALHRPLLHTAAETLLRGLAAGKGLSLRVQISGNPLTEWTLENLRITPMKGGHSSIDFIRINHANISYSPLSLLLHGPKRCIESLAAEGIRICLHTDPKNGAKPPRDLQDTLRNILAIPSLAPDSVALKQVDIEVSREGNPLLLIQEGFLTTHPEGNGVLRIERLQIQDHPLIRGLETAVVCSNHTFSIHDLALNPSLVVSKLEFGKASSPRDTVTLALAIRAGAGEIKGELRAQRSPALWRVSVEAQEFSCTSFADFWGLDSQRWPENLQGTLQIQGVPNRPHSWTGAMRAHWRIPISGETKVACSIKASLSKGELSVEETNLKSSSSEIAVKGTLHIPEHEFRLETCSGSFSLSGSCADLREWLPAGQSPGPGGSASMTATLNLARGVAQLECQADARDFRFALGGARALHAEGSFAAPMARSLSLKNIAGNGLVSADIPSLSPPAFHASMHEAVASLSLSEGALRLWNLQIRDAQNAITGEVTFPLSADGPSARANLELRLQNLGAAATTLKGHPVTGALQGSVQGELKEGLPQGTCALAGSGLVWGAFEAGDFRFRAEGTNGVIELKEFTQAWNPQEWIRATAQFDLHSPFAYEVDASAQIPRVDRTTPLFRQLGWAHHCSGSLDARWKGKGELQALTGTGTWNLKLKDARWDDVKLSAVDCVGSYRPGQLLADPLRITSPHTKVTARVEWLENTLRIENISLEQWGTPTLSGYLLLPLTRDAQGTHWVREARLAGQLRADKLDLANLYAGAGKPPEFTGLIQCSLALSGTPETPLAAFHLHASELRSKAAPRFGSVALEMQGDYQKGVFSAETKISSALKAPLLMEVEIPVDLDLLTSKSLVISQLPMKVHLQTTGASLKPLADLLPGLRQITGTASLDATLKGSLASPHWQAKLSADCPILHFASDRAPAISELHLGMELDEKHLHVRTLKADLGGGSLEIQGEATFDTPDNPTLNFKAKAKEVLAVRNRSLSLRLNGDLFLRGPWKKAVLGGSASAIKSRVQWDIDLLPLTALLPGVHKEKRASGKPWFTFTRAPFSDWKFDIALSTTPGDPIVLRGNRLRGTAEAELRFEGNGATPTLHGAYRTTDLVTSLPFARIEMSRGRVWYTRDQPFLPQIDFNAETEVRNHRIRLYLGGPADAPQISISSEPPLSETDLLTLMTTGALPSDASESSQTLASRAATVLFQEFSDKVLKPGMGTEPFSALRRFSLDLSALNSRTGHQETRLTYRLTDKFFIISEIGADGDFAGRFRYVLRFR